MIQEIFELWYRIPEYQRPYVWESDQVKELLEDTFEAYHSNPDAQYFLGFMVLKINEKRMAAYPIRNMSFWTDSRGRHKRQR